MKLTVQSIARHLELVLQKDQCHFSASGSNLSGLDGCLQHILLSLLTIDISKETMSISWKKICLKKRKKKSQSHLLSFHHHTWEKKGNWPYAACEQSAFHALVEIHPCLAKLSALCMFFRGLLKFGCLISLKAWSAQHPLWPKALEWERDFFFFISPEGAPLNSLALIEHIQG